MNIVLFPADPEGPGPAAFFLTGVSIIAILVTLPLSLCLCIKVITILAVVVNVIMMVTYLIFVIFSPHMQFFFTQKCVNQDKIDCATNNKIA